MMTTDLAEESFSDFREHLSKAEDQKELQIRNESTELLLEDTQSLVESVVDDDSTSVTGDGNSSGTAKPTVRQ